mmetsp:Transcript_27177/g.45899  ORF Transcript_27177/g.45899 Transcript_27177/m.45899 type:complete len:263 (-) Transcript_27177:209-997(-)|eukprot:CAMPEP_0114413184 /NCGR_PEP_ID=MMETSP0103-20121206/721_1 /TAXON_ID=37642 ORGANISM="Paraphysomonas imperforata, Strain PA2" /NCGR_SAMPLE_ID=MMETSP0103 /ASSEMBLY_ACC=CAM_ASM_000201 /LENGTH=262 /DNA_ID=CAMNT_0001581245 /DNA_START=151 /DNA_END=939 /DNA_ORIENTATION=+
MIRKAIARSKVLKFEPQLPELTLLDSFEACGGKMWPASDVLVQYLADNSHHTKDRHILELGSGCGYVGISLAALGDAKSVTLTDRLIKKARTTYDMEGVLNEDVVASPILLDIMKRNISTNSESLVVQPDVRELEWGPAFEQQVDKVMSTRDLNHSYDLIVGSDLTYHSTTATALFWTVRKLLTDMTKRREELKRQLAADNHDGDDWEEENKIKFITSHERRLDLSTRQILNVAMNKYQLQFQDLFSSVDRKHGVWMFTLRD